MSAGGSASSPLREGKRSSRNIKWDEDTIAEHDKERGTRQKIDEPPTPYRYQSGSDRSDSGESAGEGDDSFHRSGEDACDGGGGNAKMVASSAASMSSTPGAYSGTQQDNRATLDWSTLHAKLHYERQLQLEADERNPGSNQGNMIVADGGGLAINDSGSSGSSSSSSGGDSSRERHVFCLESGVDEDAVADPAEMQQFRDKRQAHYNEFKVIQAMRKRREAQRKSKAGGNGGGVSGSSASAMMLTSDDDDWEEGEGDREDNDGEDEDEDVDGAIGEGGGGDRGEMVLR